jgi:hypothetical protein
MAFVSARTADEADELRKVKEEFQIELVNNPRLSSLQISFLRESIGMIDAELFLRGDFIEA